MKLNLLKLLKLPELSGLSQHRAITEVDSWDGAASNYDNTEAYCAACLIDVNTAAGNTTKKQSHCMLPVKPAGSSAMADKAILAAAGGRGITAVKKPGDVDQVDWDKAIMKAAKTLISAYGQMEREPPDSIMEMAGMGVERSIDIEKVKALLLGDTKEGAELRDILTKALEDFDPEELVEEERSIILDQLMQQLYEWSYAESGRPYFTTLYFDRNNFYALFNQKGTLFRAAIDFDVDGQTLVMGELESVIHEFTPITRSGFFTVRQADGKTRFFMIAGTAIINRIGEIDSIRLYDDMIRRADESGFYPTLDFFHLGEVDSEFEFGQFDYLGREGVVYVGSGLFYEGHPLAIATERAIQDNPEAWGASIEYFRPENRGIEYVQLGGGLEVAAYTEGLNTRISVLPESAAACWFTGVTTETREMTDKKLKALRALFGDNEEGFNAFLKKIGHINREVKEKNLIHRQATEEEKTETTTQANDAQTTDAPMLELDDQVIEVIVQMARSQFESEVLKGITDNLTAITTNIATILEAQQGLVGQVNGMQERLSVLEQDDETKQRTWLSDRPAKSQKTTKVTYRPSAMARSADEEETPMTSSVKAKAVLDTLPKVGI